MEIKMDLRIQSREFITEFINVFRENPCLWKTSLIEYKIKSVKQSAYHKLLEISRKYEPQTSIDDVKKKIQSLRASHRKERRKVKDSLRTGSGIDEIYVPKLWYYTELDFLDDQEESSPSVSNLDTVTDSETDETQSILNSDVLNLRSVFTASPDCLKPSPLTPEPTKNVRVREPTATFQRKINTDDTTNKVLALITERLGQSDDEFDLIGKNVAFKLRRMTSRQKILAERLINDVMYNGISELLTSQSSLKLHSQYSDPIDGNHSISNEVNNPLQLTPQYALNYVPIKYEYESREGEE